MASIFTLSAAKLLASIVDGLRDSHVSEKDHFGMLRVPLASFDQIVNRVADYESRLFVDDRDLLRKSCSFFFRKERLVFELCELR